MHGTGTVDLWLEELAEIERRAGDLGERLDRVEAGLASNGRALDRLEAVAGKAAGASDGQRDTYGNLSIRNGWRGWKR